MRSVWMTLVLMGWLAGGVATSQAQEWGTLRGRFIYDGAPPKPEKAKITSDQEECCQHDLDVESLLVNAQNRGVQNVVIYLYQNKTSRRPTEYDQKTVPIHESYLSWKSQVAEMDNLKCRFDPHVALVWTEQTLIVGNSDPIGHNVKIDCRDNAQSNDTIPSGGTVQRRFEKPERVPVMVTCSIHPWMKGWLVIRDTPYMAVSDEEGNFEIRNLPAGDWQFMVWHEQAGYVSKVTVGGKTASWDRGILERKIAPGDNDLGEILLAPALFKM